MTDQNIITLLQRKRRYAAELAILRDCSDTLSDSQSLKANDCAILKRRLALIGHWLDFLSPDERTLIDLRFFQNRTWLYIADHVRQNGNGKLPCDERTVQRQMERAVACLFQLMNAHLGNGLDFLIDHTQSPV